MKNVADEEYPYGGTIYMLMLPEHPVINIVNIVWQPFFDGYLMVLEKKAKPPSFFNKTDNICRKVLLNRGDEIMKGVLPLKSHLNQLKVEHDIVVPKEMIQALKKNLVQGEPMRVISYIKTDEGYDRFCYDQIDSMRKMVESLKLMPTYH